MKCTLGIAGFLPISPQIYMKAWRKRKLQAQQQAAEAQQTKEEATS